MAWTVNNKNLGRLVVPSFVWVGNDLESHHEGTRVKLGSKDAKMEKELQKLFEVMDRSIDADG